MKRKNLYLLSLVFITLLVFGLVGCTNGADKEVTNGSSDMTFNPGVYSATNKGYAGDVYLEVEFDESSVVEIKIADNEETEDIGGAAMKKLSDTVLTDQIIQADIISGATHTSEAFISSVKSCFEQAGADPSEFQTSTNKGDEGKQSTESVKIEADYIVIGAGPAGLASAIEAAESGLDVVVFEKTESTGGAAKYGMGPLALATELQAKQGEYMGIDEAYDMFMEYTHYRVDGKLVRKYFDMSNDTLEWLEDMGVEFVEAARYFDKSYPSWHIVKSDEGKQGGGVASTMTRKMTERAEELGVKIFLDTPVTKIIKTNGVVAGVIAESKEAIYEASGKAVLAATGGFGNNVEMIEEKLGYTWGEDYFGMRFPGHEGDGLNMAYEVGAYEAEPNIEMIYNIYPKDGPAITNDVTIIMRQANLLVNKLGERFINEEQVQNATYTGNALVLQPENTGYMIISESIKNDYIKNDVPLKSKVYFWEDLGTFDDTVQTLVDGKSPSIYKADTLEEIAEFMGIDKDNLIKTVDEYNEICLTGKDPLGKTRELLNPLDEGPYYVAQYYPGSYGTLGGLNVSSDLEVMANDTEVVKGLYSAGTDSCNIFGDSYMFLLPGNTMGYSLNSGRIAAESVIKYIQSIK